MTFTSEPKTEAILHSKGLAEHGRDYLLERADYWERRGPLPQRPPMTDIGCKMQRQHQLTSRQTSVISQSSNWTSTPEPAMPGVVEYPEDDIEIESQRASPDDKKLAENENKNHSDNHSVDLLDIASDRGMSPAQIVTNESHA